MCHSINSRLESNKAEEKVVDQFDQRVANTGPDAELMAGLTIETGLKIPVRPRVYLTQRINQLVSLKVNSPTHPAT